MRRIRRYRNFPGFRNMRPGPLRPAWLSGTLLKALLYKARLQARLQARPALRHLHAALKGWGGRTLARRGKLSRWHHGRPACRRPGVQPPPGRPRNLAIPAAPPFQTVSSLASRASLRQRQCHGTILIKGHERVKGNFQKMVAKYPYIG